MTGTQFYRYLINISPINELVRQPASLLTQSDWVPQEDWIPSQTGTQSDWVTSRTGTQSDWTGAYLPLTHAALSEFTLVKLSTFLQIYKFQWNVVFFLPFKLQFESLIEFA